MPVTIDSDVARSRSPTTGPSDDRSLSDAVYARTAKVLRKWVATEATDNRGTLREHHLRRHLWKAFSAAGRATTVTAPRGTDTPDIVVDDSVGIKIVSALNQGATGWFRRELHTLGEGYDYLVVFGYGIGDDDRDRWRHLQSSTTPKGIDVRGVSFVDSLDTDDETGTSVWPPLAPETMALLVVTLPLALVGAKLLAEFVLSLETIGASVVVAVALVYLLGASLLGLVLKLL